MPLTEEEVRRLIEEGKKLGLSERAVREIIDRRLSFEENLMYLRLFALIKGLTERLGSTLGTIISDISRIRAELERTRKEVEEVAPPAPIRPEELEDYFVTKTGILHKPEKVWRICPRCGREFPTFDDVTLRYLISWTRLPEEYFYLCPKCQKEVFNLAPLWVYLKGLSVSIPPEAQKAIFKVLADIAREWEEAKRYR